MRYIHVGSNYINPSLFDQIDNPYNNYSMIPTGGLWLSDYYENFCSWVDYILFHRSLFYIKYGFNNSLPSVIITLKETAKIFYVQTEEDLNWLFFNYPSKNSFFDYKLLSQDYDGIYFNPINFCNSLDVRIKNAMAKFSIRSLVLFNLECIATYQKAVVNLNLASEDYTDYTIAEIDNDIDFHNPKLKREYVKKSD